MRRRVGEGRGKVIEEDDSDSGGDGGGQGSSGLQGPVRPLAHPSQQVQAGRVLPPMEVPGPASLLRKVPGLYAFIALTL